MKRKYCNTICTSILALTLTLSLVGCGNDNSGLSPSTKLLKPDESPIQGSSIPVPDETMNEDSATDSPVTDLPTASSTASQENTDPDIAVTDFSMTLFQRSFQKEQNTLISPLSVLCALSMTANGARGNTLTQMESTLGLPPDKLNEYLHAYTISLPNEEKCKFNLANSIWFKKSDSFTPTQEFLQICREEYLAEIYQTPFDDSTLRDINHWVNTETDGMIENILSDIPEEAVMYLVNALAFDAEWQDIYFEHQVSDSIFTTESGITQDVEMMYSEENNYLLDENAQGFMKYYAGQKYAFAALLPDENVSISDYIASLDGKRLHDILANPINVQVNAAMPKFESEFDIEMNGILQKMGMTDAFDAELADFSGIGHSDLGPLTISKVLHKTFIAVNEKGTEAGAATVVGMNESCAVEMTEPKTVYLDRPFVYMIVDCEKNIPIFMGTVMDMEK